MTNRRTNQLLVAATLLAGPSMTAAQTDYYNTDRGRPIQIEDAHSAERYALELKLAPVRLERGTGGIYHWGIEPELAYGFLPRTHVEVGVPVSYTDGAGSGRWGVSGIEASLFHNLNAETRGLPAFAVRADVLAPVGNLAADDWYGSLTGIATRTFSAGRVHLNGQYTMGAEPTVAGGLEQSRWLAGLALDKPFALRSMLVTVEGFASRPLASGSAVEYSTGAGVRYQLTPTLAIDGGAGRRLNGDDEGWYITFGTAYAFGLASWFPTGR